MRVNPFYATTVFIAWSLFGLVAPASATCTWYPLTNGNTADAMQVTADFNCLQGNVEIDNGSLVLNGYEWSQGPNAGYAFWDRTNASNAWVWYSTGNTAFLWKNFNTTANVVSVDQNGNVGIGTSTPDASQRLTLDKTTGDGNYGGIRFNVAGTNIGYIEQEGTGNMYYNANGDIYLRPGNIFLGAMVLKASGFVGIGTNSPSYALHVNGTAYATGAAGALSDVRHKKTIATLKDGALQNIMDLRPVTFEWKEPKDDGMKGQQIGFVAQEVEEVLPSVVLTQNNAEKTKGLKYNELVAVMAKAIQELKKENDRESAVVAGLKKQVAALQGGRHSVASSEPILRRVQVALGWH